MNNILQQITKQINKTKITQPLVEDESRKLSHFSTKIKEIISIKLQ